MDIRNGFSIIIAMKMMRYLQTKEEYYLIKIKFFMCMVLDTITAIKVTFYNVKILLKIF